MAQNKTKITSKNGRQSVESPKESRQRRATSSAQERKVATRSSARTKATTQGAKSSSASKNTPPTPKAQATSKPQAKPQTKPQNKSVAPERGESELHIWCGLVLFLVGAFVLLSMISYLRCWEQDADLLNPSTLLVGEPQEAANWCGRLGAIIGDRFISKWIGVAALAVPFALLVSSVMLMISSRKRWFLTMISVLLVALSISIMLGHFYGFDAAVFGSGWGGLSGVYLSSWMHSLIGYEGSGLLIIFVLIAVFYYAFGGYIRKFARVIAKHRERRAKVRSVRREQERLRLLELEEKNRITAENIERQRQEMAEQRKAEVLSISQKQVVEAPKDEPTEEEPTKEETRLEPVVEPVSIPAEHYTAEHYTAEQPVEEQTIEEPFNVEVEEEQSSIPTVPNLKSRLIKLEGNQWGFIQSYNSLGAPLYLYYDRSDIVASASAEIFDDEDEEIFTVREQLPEPQIDEPKIESEEQKIAFTITETHSESFDQVVAPIAEQATPQKPTIGFEVEKAGEEEKLGAVDINTMKLYDPTAELSTYRKPMVELLQNHTQRVIVTEEELTANKDRIVHTLLTFGIKIDSIKATIGPTVTLYEIIPAPGVRISKIKNLEDDIALSLSALGIRIIAPIPGKGTIGIEVPNQDKETVSMSSVIRSAKFQDIKAELPIALGKTIQNETFVFDLAKMPHLLVAGATGQGKSVGLNAIITSLLYKKHPSELKFVLVDPKKVELTLYGKLEKHFLAKMEGEDEAIITDTQKVVYTLNSLCKEMDSRYDLLKMAEVRNIVEYNNKFIHRRLLPTKGHRFLPYFVVIIDEFADLIMTAGREIETPIARIAQLARAVGIHLIIATQRPTTNIITGVIKANFPARIAFRVTSMIDSRTILDTPGANQLIGRGDMLVSTGSEITRVQCAFIDTPEVEDISKFISQQRGYVGAYELPEYVPESEQGGAKDVDMSRKDPLFAEVARHVVATQTGSASTIQRKFAIGFNRAGRIVDQLEAAGIVGSQSGSKPREVLIKDPMTLEMIIDE